MSKYHISSIFSRYSKSKNKSIKLYNYEKKHGKCGPNY